MATPDPQRGDVWLVDWSPGRGSEQIGRRPGLVIQTDAANSNPRYPNTIVLTVSTKGHPVTSHIRVEPSSANGLRETSYIKCEQVMTISKDHLQIRFGKLGTQEMARVVAGLRQVLAI